MWNAAVHEQCSLAKKSVLVGSGIAAALFHFSFINREKSFRAHQKKILKRQS